jgi:cyclomaltodextrinase / maltogenic alpha-amylase / neopullulanase
VLLAEASERDPYDRAAGFDAAYDWTDKPGEWAWNDAFATKAPAARLRAALTAERDSGYVFRFLDNNDTGARFISRHGTKMTRPALAMLMTLPRVPCLSMGDEVGAAIKRRVASRAERTLSGSRKIVDAARQ